MIIENTPKSGDYNGKTLNPAVYQTKIRDVKAKLGECGGCQCDRCHEFDIAEGSHH